MARPRQLPLRRRRNLGFLPGDRPKGQLRATAPYNIAASAMSSCAPIGYPQQRAMITLLHLITGLETGGAERMVLHLAARADRSRFRTVVVSLAAGGAIAPLIAAAGIPVRTLGMRRGVPD